MKGILRRYPAPVCGLLLFLWAQPADSQAIIDLRIAIPGGPVARIAAVDGQMVTLQHGGLHIGFTARAGGNSGLTVEVRELLPEVRDTRAPIVQAIELPRGRPGLTRHGWAMEFVGTRSRRPGTVTTMDICCLTCSGNTACACAVRMACGQCCSNAQCCQDLDTRLPRKPTADFASVSPVWARTMYSSPCPEQIRIGGAFAFVAPRG